MIAAKKLLMAGQAAKPFARFGGFETGLEGWEVVNGSHKTSGGRTSSGPSSVEVRQGSMTYRLTAKEARGLRIIWKMYIRARSNSENRIEFIVDGSVVQSVHLGSRTSYILESSEFVCPHGKGIDIRLVIPGGVQDIDDWRIEGVRP